MAVCLEKETLKDLHSAQELENYLRSKGRKHTVYKIYGTYERIKSWEREECLYLSDGSNWNDRHDRETFNNDALSVRRFGQCFSFATSESVAMWMLYGGMQQRGAMVEFSRKAMGKILRTSRVDYGYFDAETQAYIVCGSLERSNFELDVQDILYVRKSRVNPELVYIKRSDESTQLSREIVDQLPYCVKSMAWNYESECRLVLTVKKALVPRNCTTIRIWIPEVYHPAKKEIPVKFVCAPNFSGKLPYEASQLGDEVAWDLCYKCHSKE